MSMDMTPPLVLSRDAHLRWDADGKLVASGVRSAEVLRIEGGDIDVIGAFAEPTEPEALLERRLRRERDPNRRQLARSEFSTLIEGLGRIGVLVPVDPGKAVDAGQFASPQRQLTMLWDSLRTNAYRAALERSARGKVLVEIGCGHGVLACLAARAGASRVYAIEETRMIEVARDIARLNRMDDRIVFVEGNSLDVELPERADVIYADLMGPDPLGAGLLVYARDAALRFLHPGGVLIPSRLTLLAVGVDSERIVREVSTADRWLRDAEALSGTYGLDLSPLAEAARGGFARAYDSFSYKQFLEPAVGRSAGADRILTREARVAEFELGGSDPARAVDTRLSLPVEREGTLNAIATSAVVHLDEETALSTSPFAKRRPSAWGGQFVSTLSPINVVAGTTVAVEASVRPWASPAVGYRHSAGSGSDRAEALFGA
jgi:Ribosomal protein L11 methyltransferase (PrmA)